MFEEDGSYIHRWKGVFVLSLALLIIALDNTVLNVALPVISEDLLASAKDLQWIVDVYVLFFASLLLTFGALGDRYGRKLLLNIGMIIFALGSLGAALSTSTEMLIMMRGVTGIGGAAMMPATLSILTDMFRDPKERTKAIAVWSMTFGIGFGFGPVLGGWLVDDFSWELVFYINIPVVAITMLFGKFFLPESKDSSRPQEDLLGMILSVLGLFALVYAIIHAGVVGWFHEEVIIYFVAAVVLLGIFISWEKRCTHAMLPMGLFKNPSFLVASVAITLVMFGMMGTMYFFTQYFQTIQGYSAFEAGLLLIPLTIALTVGAGIAPATVEKFKLANTTFVGILLSALSMLYFALLVEVDTSLTIVIIGFIMQGFGIGLAMTPGTDSIMGSIPESKLGVGSAMNDATRELGGALSIAVMGAMMNATYIAATSILEKAPELKALHADMIEFIGSSIQAAHIVARDLNNEAMSKMIISVADEGFVLGMQEAMIMGTVVTFLAAFLTLWKLPNEIRQSKEEEV